MATKAGTGAEEQHKRKANDCNLKLRGQQDMSNSPEICMSVRKDWSESLPNDNAVSNEDKDFGRCFTSLAASGPPSTSYCSMVDAELVVDEMTVRNHKNPNSPLVKYPHSSRQSPRNQIGDESRYKSLSREMVSWDGEQITCRVSKEVKGIGYDFWSLKVNYDPEKVSANVGNENTLITSSNALLIGSIMQKNLSPYDYSQLAVKQTLKGKGVICEDGDTHLGLRGGLMSREDEMPSFVTKFHSDKLLRSNADDNKPSIEIVNSSTESFDGGINLREWLKSSSNQISKSRSLYIFKQVLEFVDTAHSQGIVLEDLRLSSFALLASNKVRYIGSSGQGKLDNVMPCNVTKKRPMEMDMCGCYNLSTKQQKLCKEPSPLGLQHHFTCTHPCSTKAVNQMKSCTTLPVGARSTESVCQSFSRHHNLTEEKQFMTVTVELEDKWYSSPEELNDGHCTFSSNIYSLGVLLFELMCNIESWEAHSTAMLDLHNRILPPRFLSENPKEAGFCLWLLHPEPSSRPSTRMILQSEFICELEELKSEDDVSVCEYDETETEGLLYFLKSLRGEKQKQTSKLAEELRCLDEDIKEVERRYSFGTNSRFSYAQKDVPELRGYNFYFQDPFSSDIHGSIPGSFVNEERLMRNISQLEDAYFSMRSQILQAESEVVAQYDKEVLKSRGRLSHIQNDTEEPRRVQRSGDCLGSFFEGLCKFAHYSKFEERATLRNKDLLNSANVICALSFDRNEDYIAAAGVSKKIKIFDLSSIFSDSIDIHYPIVEMSNQSKLSCVCWNSYIKNHLASTDYNGVVQMWDASTGQPFSQYSEHKKRAWSVDFSEYDPKMFASGSDDCSVKLWNINEKNSLGTIWNPANICCVQFSSFSTHLLVFGSADYKIYGYDLRHTRIPWCTLAGHGKAVSYVKFVDSETLVSASTDNSLKLWDLKKSSSSGLSSGACDLTFKGHTNEKNFVGLSVLDGYIACGSETNEVYSYHRSLPVPITSHKFGSIDPISGHENNDSNGQFVSSVCWRKKSKMLVAANSIGIVKLLQMV